MNPTILDIAGLREITEGDPAVETHLFSSFEETGERCLAFMLSLTEDEGEGWATILHELRGAAANVRAVRLAELCREAELLPARSDLRNAAYEAISQALSEISAEFNRLLTK